MSKTDALWNIPKRITKLRLMETLEVKLVDTTVIIHNLNSFVHVEILEKSDIPQEEPNMLVGEVFKRRRRQ